jgi:hypothetical protein
VGRLTYVLPMCERRHATQPRTNLSCGSSLNLGPVAMAGALLLSAVAGERHHDADAPLAGICRPDRLEQDAEHVQVHQEGVLT